MKEGSSRLSYFSRCFFRFVHSLTEDAVVGESWASIVGVIDEQTDGTPIEVELLRKRVESKHILMIGRSFVHKRSCIVRQSFPMLMQIGRLKVRTLRRPLFTVLKPAELQMILHLCLIRGLDGYLAVFLPGCQVFPWNLLGNDGAIRPLQHRDYAR